MRTGEIMAVFTAVLFVLLCSVIQTQAEVYKEKQTVSTVHQHFKSKINQNLAKLTHGYLELELANKAYAAFFDRADVALPGFSKFFKTNSLRMRDIGFNVTRYINKRGGFSSYDPIKLLDVCKSIDKVLVNDRSKICRYQDEHTQSKIKTKKQKSTKKNSMASESIGEWEHGLLGLKDALAMEKILVERAVALISLAKANGDVMSKHFLEMNCYDTDHVKYTADLVTKINSYGSGEDYRVGEYLLDQELNS